MDRNFDNKERWAAVLRTYQSQPVSVLEIGSWIGGSAKVFLDLLPLGRITCVDVFDGKFLGHPEQESDFDRNVAPYGDRVEKIKSRSIPALDGLAQAGRSFDIIYVDGSHTRDDALMDTVLAWRMLKPNGTMIWDDYVWQLGKLPAEERPQDAIDVFLEWHADELTVLERVSSHRA